MRDPFHNNPHFHKLLLPHVISSQLLDVSMFSISTIKILTSSSHIKPIPFLLSLKYEEWHSLHKNCVLCFLHRLLSPYRPLVSISINLSFLFCLLWNTNCFLNTARLLFLLQLLGHLADKRNSTNCFRIILSKLFLPIDLASKSKTTEEFKHNIIKI